MLICNPITNHAFVVGEVVGVKDAGDEYFMIRVKHHVYNAVEKSSQDKITAIFISNVAENIQKSRPAIAFADMARRMKIHIGSRVGVYCIPSLDWKTATGYSVSYDGFTKFRGLNRNDEPTTFTIVMGIVKRIRTKLDRNGKPFASAHVYVGKWRVKDANGNFKFDKSGNPIYQYKYVDISAKTPSLVERFKKALRPSDTVEKA